MDLIGKLFEKREAVKRTETFTAREFVLEIESNNSQYKDYVIFQLTNDRCSVIDRFNIGDELHVTFDIRGRRWVRPADGVVMYFNTLSAWRIEPYAPQQYSAMQRQEYPQQGYQQGFQQGGYQQPAQPTYGQMPPVQPAAAPQSPSFNSSDSDGADNLPF